jgi:multidrug efflux pump subunit AcrA (membrane-fusion protein)
VIAVGALAVVVGVGAAATTGALPALPPSTAAAEASPTPGADVRTAEIQTRTMRTAADLDGTLGYEDGEDVAAGAAGTLTRLPDEGSVIERNGVLYELDGRVRPRLLYGSRPLWRPLGPGVSDGADVLQLERNLEAMGYAPKGMKVDRHWSNKTTRAVKRWQKANKRTRDGTLDGSDIAFLPGPIRVAVHEAALGSQVGPGAPVLSATTARRVVTLDLSASRQDLAKAGQAVSVELPDGTLVNGTIREVGRVATASQDGSSTTVPVTIDLDSTAALPDLDAAPVTVHVVVAEHPDVLSVPVSALVALLEGGYAVEVVDDDGSHRYLAVETDLFEDGNVEIRGDGLAAGMKVVVAR